MVNKFLVAAVSALAVSWAPPAQAEEELTAFLEANVISILYHELGHAVIDVMKVPIFGQEEDAADVMAVLLIDWMFEEDSAQDIACDSAFGYINDPDQTEEVAYWDVHGPDEQRYYNHVCLFYGANPDAREDLADDLGLPEERLETCPEEYDLAAESWGAVFDEMAEARSGRPIAFVAGSGADAALANRVIGAEIAALNDEIALPENLEVRVEGCGEANAFYDPADISITFCTEFIAHLSEIFEAVSAE